MTVGRHRPTLWEILQILDACTVSSATELGDNKWEFHIVFDREKLATEVPDWNDGLPKPAWLFQQIKEELHAWGAQRIREEQWVSKEDRFGAGIDSVIAYWAGELKRVSKLSSVSDHIAAKFIPNTIIRLQELKERRGAGGVYSKTEDRREKARKAWMEDEYEAPKREEEQRRQREQTNYSHQQAYGDYQQWDDPFGGLDETLRRQAEDLFKRYSFRYDWYDTNPPPKSGNKRSWHEVLGVSISATKKDITKAYRKLAAKYHPDRYKEPDGHAKMAEINTARDEGLNGL